MGPLRKVGHVVGEYRSDYTAKWDSSGGIKGAAGGQGPAGQCEVPPPILFFSFVLFVFFFLLFSQSLPVGHIEAKCYFIFRFILAQARLDSQPFCRRSPWTPRFLVSRLLIAFLYASYSSTSFHLLSRSSLSNLLFVFYSLMA